MSHSGCFSLFAAFFNDQSLVSREPRVSPDSGSCSGVFLLLQPLSRKEPGLLPAPGKGKLIWDKIKSRMAPAPGLCRGLAPFTNPIPCKQPWRAGLPSHGSNIPPSMGRGPISLQESPLNYGETLGCPQPSPSPHPPSHPAEPILSQATNGYFTSLLLFCCCCGKFFAAGLSFFHSSPFSKVS